MTQKQQENNNLRIINDKNRGYFLINSRVAIDERLTLEEKGFYFWMVALREQLPINQGIQLNSHYNILSLKLIQFGYLEEVYEDQGEKA